MFLKCIIILRCAVLILLCIFIATTAECIRRYFWYVCFVWTHFVPSRSRLQEITATTTKRSVETQNVHLKLVREKNRNENRKTAINLNIDGFQPFIWDRAKKNMQTKKKNKAVVCKIWSLVSYQLSICHLCYASTSVTMCAMQICGWKRR